MKRHETDEYFCHECKAATPHEKVEKLGRYRVIIAVDGSIDGKSVSGVTSRTVAAEDKRSAKRKAEREFRENPDYNTDISVNKNRFPDGEYLDNWGYQKTSARAVHAEPADEASRRVKWRNYGDKV